MSQKYDMEDEKLIKRQVILRQCYDHDEEECSVNQQALIIVGYVLGIVLNIKNKKKGTNVFVLGQNTKNTSKVLNDIM